MRELARRAFARQAIPIVSTRAPSPAVLGPAPGHAAPEHRALGILLRITGSICYALMAALLKAASEAGANTSEMIFYRNAGALPVVLVWLLAGPGLGAVRTRRPWSHVTRSTVGLVSMYLTYGAIVLLPLGEATTLTYSAPILATILSAVLLHEAVGPRRWAAVAVGFAGVLLVAGARGVGAPPTLGLIVGLAAAGGQAAVMITLRTIARREGTGAIVFWYTIGCTLFGLLILPLFGHAHAGWVYGVLLGSGVFGGAGQLAMTGSLRYAPVSVVVPFDYVQIVCAMLIGWAVFADAPVATTLLGALLIAASGIYTAYRESRRGRVPNEAAAQPLE